jgi:hypothetical protein
MTNKRRSNNNSKLPTTASSSGSSAPASKNNTSQTKPPSRSPSPAQNVTGKRPRTEADNAMEQDHALAPTDTNAPPPPASNTSQNTAAPTFQVSAPNTSSPSRPSLSTGSPDNFLNASQHAPSNNVSSSEPKGKDKEVFFQQHATSPDASAATVQAATFRFHTRTFPNAVEGFNDKFKTNRDACDAVNRYFTRFSSYGSRV